MGLLDQFPHRCTIRHRVRSADGLGGSQDSYTNDSTDIRCWEQAASFTEVEQYEKRGMRVSRKVYFLADPDVTVRSQILITERQGTTVSSPTPLDVRTEAQPDAGAGLGVVYKVMCDVITSSEDQV
jgi:hypothetical protein